MRSTKLFFFRNIALKWVTVLMLLLNERETSSFYNSKRSFHRRWETLFNKRSSNHQEPAGGCLMLHICVLYRRGRDVAGSSRVTIITTSVFRVWVSRGLATLCRQLSVSVATVKYFSTTKNRNNFAQRKWNSFVIQTEEWITSVWEL